MTSAYLNAIVKHCEGLAEAARGDLDRPVEHCPGWNVADLVAHVTDVHWFWTEVVDGLLNEPPDVEQRPARVANDRLIRRFLSGARGLVETLRMANQGAPCWTWAPLRHDVAFVTRHQAQEAAVHHWDAENAAGHPIDLEREISADAIDEFLEFSVATEIDPAQPGTPRLNGSFAMHATDIDKTWLVTDGGDEPARVKVLNVDSLATDNGVVAGTSSDLLLWLYARKDVDVLDISPELIDRFRKLCFTD
ncbi:MAG TPA: maleylpyruvate isomerase family mycothiol-dependent enzyme [Jiangellaceae bacterium]